MNKLTIATSNNTAENSRYSEDNLSVVITNGKENWNINANVRDKNGEVLELTELQIILHNGLTWTGTIQCFAAIHDFANNALTILREDASIGFTDQEDQENIDSSVKEMVSLLSHFTKDNSPAVSEATSIQLLESEAKHLQNKINAMRDRISGGSDNNDVAIYNLGMAQDSISDAMYNLHTAIKSLS